MADRDAWWETNESGLLASLEDDDFHCYRVPLSSRLMINCSV